VSKIAYASGFESLSTFNDRFRKLATVSPKECRREPNAR